MTLSGFSGYKDGKKFCAIEAIEVDVFTARPRLSVFT